MCQKLFNHVKGETDREGNEVRRLSKYLNTIFNSNSALRTGSFRSSNKLKNAFHISPRRGRVVLMLNVQLKIQSGQEFVVSVHTEEKPI